MNILLVTTLYPDSPNQSLTDVPFTLHYFVKNWITQGHDVQVIKIEATYPKFIPIYSKINKKRVARESIIDEVPIYVLQVQKNLRKEFSLRKSKASGKLALNYLLAKNFVCDVIIFHIFYPNFFIANEIKKHFNVPLVYGIHQSDLMWTRKHKNQKILDYYNNKIDAYAFRSKMLKNKLRNVLNFDKYNFQIPSGIPSKIIDKQSKIRNNLAKNLKVRNFITVANLKRRKNIDIVIKSFKILKKQYKDIKLTIIGDGVEKKRLEHLAKYLQLEDSVVFLGHQSREKIFEILSLNDAFILPSVNETFGIVYLEAMANSCIPIGTYNEGVDGIILDNYNGFLCNPEVNDCYLAMKKVIELEKNNIKRILQNMNYTIQNFTDESCSEKYISNIGQLLNGGDDVE